jgi:hypothetical protein
MKRITRLTIAALIGTHAAPEALRGGGFFTFDVMTISQAFPGNAPAMSSVQGYASVTLYGMNWMSVDITPTVEMSADTGYMCQTTSWSTTTAVRCQAALNGYLQARTLNARFGVTAFASTQTYTFDAPLLTNVAVKNAMQTIGQTVTISGINFGNLDTTPESYTVTVACATTAWTTSTIVACGTPVGTGVGAVTLALGFTNAGYYKYFGTQLQAFSFDAPVASFAASYNGPKTGGESVSIIGLNFASIDPTPSASLELSVECSSTSWTSATAVECAAASYRGGTMRIAVTVAGLVGTTTGQFSFDGTGACAAVRRGTCNTMIVNAARCAQLRP